MELDRAIRARRMVRAFDDLPVDPSALTELLDLARRAPSAGHTAATEFVVLTGDDRRRYWDLTLPAERRANFTFSTLPLAGALVLVLTTPEAYPQRYSEPDKRRTGLGEGLDRWPVPFWWVDAGAVIENLLLLVADRGLGACLFGVFEHEAAICTELNIPPDRRIVAAIAVGHPSDDSGPRGRSQDRSRPPIEQIIHRQGYSPAEPEPS